MVQGVFNVDKPLHYTSHDVVAAIRALGFPKVGHAGTLDPLATGVLPVCVGQATKIIPFLQDTPKTYVARMRLGIRTDTQDASGRVLATASTQGITEQKVEQICKQFIGISQQIPPMYSAVKHQGKPLYYFARQGLELPRASRTITIFSLDLLFWNEEEVIFKVVCSRGTYIRTLCDDIGERLGCGAHLSQLVRMQVGPFHLREAVSLEQLRRLRAQNRTHEVLYSLDQALAFLPGLLLTESQVQQLCQGLPITLEKCSGKENMRSGFLEEVTLDNTAGRDWVSGTRLRLYDPDQQLFAIGELCFGEKDCGVSSDRLLLRPLRVLRVFRKPK